MFASFFAGPPARVLGLVTALTVGWSVFAPSPQGYGEPPCRFGAAILAAMIGRYMIGDHPARASWELGLPWPASTSKHFLQMMTIGGEVLGLSVGMLLVPIALLMALHEKPIGELGVTVVVTMMWAINVYCLTIGVSALWRKSAMLVVAALAVASFVQSMSPISGVPTWVKTIVELMLIPISGLGALPDVLAAGASPIGWWPIAYVFVYPFLWVVVAMWRFRTLG